MEGKFEKRDVIQQYSNFDSQVYAPMTRIGVYLDSGSEQFNVKSKFSTTLEGMSVLFAYSRSYMVIIIYVGLVELEDTLPHNVLNSRYPLPCHAFTMPHPPTLP